MEIKFIPTSSVTENIIPMPKPAKNYIPEWYKQIRPDGDDYNYGAIKKCMPFLDGLSSGYIQELWTDVEIIKTGEDSADYKYPDGPKPLIKRQVTSLDIPESYYNVEFTWKIHWLPKLPAGWSMLFTSPSNRPDLPFRCFDAIIDSDDFYQLAEAGGNYPVLFNKGFSGVIPAGTPMYQMIPIKREQWSSAVEKYNKEEAETNRSKIKQYIENGYKKVHWHKKEYN